MSVLDEIAAERRRQVEDEGYGPEHDDRHCEGQLANAAAVYALQSNAYGRFWAEDFWPWAEPSWKPKDSRRDLIRAAALIVAEIERLDRASHG